MARQENLTVIKGGLNRQRTKGAALKDSLYELLNGYVTTEKTVKVRPGTLLDETLTPGTLGLVSFNGKFHVFASSSVAGLPSNYELHILRAPGADPQPTLTKIHFAKPFLGFLYVSAEFSDGAIYHYWLREGATWAADTAYKFNSVVEPTTPNGFVYRPTRGEDANPLWTPNAPRSVGDKVEPTTENDFYFEVDEVFGSETSGDTEPDWSEPQEGQIFLDYADGTTVPPDSAPRTPPLDDRIPPELDDRYTDGRFRR